MLHKTRGIVFKITNYSESSVVAQIFTEKFGLQSYVIPGVKKPKAKIRLSMLQPLHLLNMVVYHKENSGLQRIAELKHEPVFQTIPYEIYKTSIVIFLNEVLTKVIRHEVVDEILFEYLLQSLLFLDTQMDTCLNFHLSFLLKLSHYLGITPSFEGKSRDVKCFDLSEGCYLTFEPIHPYYISLQDAATFEDLFFTDFGEIDTLQIGNAQRRQLIRKILDYYHLHVSSLAELKSLEVLEQILS